MGLFPAGCLCLTGKPLERDGPPSAPWQMEGFLLSSALREERAPALPDPAQSQDPPRLLPCRGQRRHTKGSRLSDLPAGSRKPSLSQAS